MRIAGTGRGRSTSSATARRGASRERLFAPLGRARRFLGLVEDAAALATLYARSDLFVWPAVNEAYGMALLEAQARRLPGGGRSRSAASPAWCATARRDCWRRPDDAPAFAAAVAALLDDPARRRDMGEAAARFVCRERTVAQAARVLRDHAHAPRLPEAMPLAHPHRRHASARGRAPDAGRRHRAGASRRAATPSTLVSGGNAGAAGAHRRRRGSCSLPPVHVDGTAFSRAHRRGRRGRRPRLCWRGRRAQLLGAPAASAPDVVITELFPFGRRALAEDSWRSLAAARSAAAEAASPVARCATSSSRRRNGRASDAAHQRLADLYDGVLVHGDPDVVPLERSGRSIRQLKPRSALHRLCRRGSYRITRRGRRRGGEIVVSGGRQRRRPHALSRRRSRPPRCCRIGRGASWSAAGVPEAAFGALAAQRSGERHRRASAARFPRAPRPLRRLGEPGRLQHGARPLERAGTGGRGAVRRRAARPSSGCAPNALPSAGLLRVLPESGSIPKASLPRSGDALAAPRPAASGIRTDGLDGAVRIVEELRAPAASRPAATSKADWSALRRRAGAACRRRPEPDACGGATTTPFGRRPPSSGSSRLAQRYGMPVALAVVPAKADGRLGAAARGRAARVGPGARSRAREPCAGGGEEGGFGPHRPLDRLVADASLALETACARLGHGPEPIFVPPWNRLAADLVPRLSALGYRGLSTFGAAARRQPAPGLVQINTHIDPDRLARHPRAAADERHYCNGRRRRLSKLLAMSTDEAEPIGLLTHHLVHDEDTWTFCERLLETFAGRPGIRVAAASQLFGSAPSK